MAGIVPLGKYKCAYISITEFMGGQFVDLVNAVVKETYTQPCMQIKNLPACMAMQRGIYQLQENVSCLALSIVLNSKFCCMV